MEPRYYFEKEHRLRRVFVMYGNTNDFYTTLNNGWYSAAPLIESHLKMLGYQVVLFYSGGKTLRCYDQEHAENRRKFFPVRGEGGAKAADAGAEKPEPVKTQPEAKGPAGAGKISGRKPRPLGAKKVEKPKEESEAAPLQFSYREEDIPEYLDRIMNDSKVKSAVVFSNAGTLLGETTCNNKLASYISSWYGLRSNNENIAVLLFQERFLEALPTLLRTNCTWRFLYENVFVDQKENESLIRIGAPKEDEIEYLLNVYVPEFQDGEALYRRGIDKGAVIAAAGCLVSRHGRRLTALKSYIDRQGERALDALLEEYGTASEEDALEHIRKTEGWEEVSAVLDRIMDSATKNHGGEIKRGLNLNTRSNMRMSYDAPGTYYDINFSMVLRGSPGTGKTTVAYWIGEALRQNGLLPSGHIIKVTRKDLVGEYVGHTAVKTASWIEEAKGGILFVDEAYSLYRRGVGGETNDFGIEAIETILEAMTSLRGQICVIFAGYPDEMDTMLSQSNSGLIRRFEGNIITIPDYSSDLLERIALRRIAERNAASGSTFRFVIGHDLALSESEQASGVGMDPLDFIEKDREDRREDRPLAPISVYFDNWYADRDKRSFGNAGSAIELAERLMASAISRSGDYASVIPITKADFGKDSEKMFICRKPTMSEVDKQMQDVVGMQKVKDTLKRITAYMQLVNIQREALKGHGSAGVVPPAVEAGNYLFVGNPGVGKTMIAEKLALTLSGLGVIGRYRPIRMTGLDLINRLQNDGIEKLKEYLRNCRGSVLVIDEAHQLASNPAGSVVIKALLDPMIEFASDTCFVFCCYPSQRSALLGVDDGLARRISDVFIFEDYSPEEVTQIFELKAKKAGYIIGSELMERILALLTDLHKMGRDMWENGGIAEKLLKEIRVSMGLRLIGASDVRSVSAAVQEGDMPITDLYKVELSDVEAAFERVRNNLVRKSGRENPLLGN